MNEIRKHDSNKKLVDVHSRSVSLLNCRVIGSLIIVATVAL